MIFEQFRTILLLGPSKSGCSLWVKKWITTDYYGCDGRAAGEEGEGKRLRNCLIGIADRAGSISRDIWF